MKTSRIIAVAMLLCLLLSGFAHAEGSVVTGAIEAEVSVEGLYPADTYTIEMRPEKAGYPMPEGSKDGVFKLTLSGPGKDKIPSISFDKLGVYNYTIRQLPGSNPFVKKYDDTVYTYTVAVTQGASSREHQAWLSVNGKDDKPDKVSFVNSYLDPTPVEHDPPVKKVINTVPDGNPYFQFRLTAISNTVGLQPKDMPMPEGASNGVMTVQVKAGEEREFGALVFDQEGTYVYEITEVDTKLDYVTYDTAVYTLTYDITLNRTTWKYEKNLTIRKDGAVVDKATFDFTNQYTAPTETSEPKPGPKTGVQDYWPYLLGGAAALLLAAAIMLIYLRRSRDKG